MSRAGVGSWTLPGAFEEAPGIHRLPLPMRDDGLRAVNVYAIEDADGLTLVDGGWAIPEARDVLGTSLRSMGRDVDEIRRIVVTHAHVDHYTLAIRLRDEVGAKVLVGRGEQESLRWLSGDGPRHRFQADQLVAAGAPRLAEHIARDDGTHDPVNEGWQLPDEWLEEGELKVGERILKVLETPGHTHGHIVLWSEADGLMFTGDQILPHITPSIGFESVPRRQPLVSFLASLQRVRGLPDARMLPAHGPTDVMTHERVDQLVAHHGRRLEQTRAAVAGSHGVNVHEVASALTWTRHERRFDELDDFNQTLAVGETYAHLAYLVHEAVLVASEDLVPLYTAARDDKDGPS